MGRIIEQGFFEKNIPIYASRRLDEARLAIIDEYQQYSRKTTVFISHKHDELQELKEVLCFLEEKYDVRVYIDSQDPTMPKKTSEITASNLKNRIKKCDKFILLATNGAIESKWCNWELGYGDAQKFKDHIALFPIKPKGSLDSSYKGAEYLSLYPYICYEDGTNRYGNGLRIEEGYYVVIPKNEKNIFWKLSDWLSRK